MKTMLKLVFKKIARTSIYSEMLSRSDYLTDILARRFANPAGMKGHTVIYTPAGDGNIGDHAMLNAHLAQVKGDVIVVSAGSDSPIETDISSTLVKVFPLRNSYFMPVFLRIPSVFYFGRLLNGANEFYIHGADTMDGGNETASLARWSLANLANSRGIKSAVLGFSYSDKVPANVTATIKRVSSETRLFARDPEGYRRMKADGIGNLTQVADMAFSRLHHADLKPEYTKWVESNKASGFVVLNTSGFIQKRMDQMPEFEEIISQVRKAGLPLVFLPHVIRDVDSDLNLARKCFESFGSERDLLVQDLFTPSQIQKLVSDASAVVTGRMHLSILSLRNEIPVIALSTAGKVTGLFELFNLGKFVVEPNPGYGKEVASRLEEMLASREVLVSQIHEKLPTVCELSMKNFSSK